jgi:streptomycin 3"-adenylyltransferase
MIDYNWANCSKVIKSEVQTLLTELQQRLGTNIQGIYLNGSLAAGGFNPERSDIDILVVIADELSGKVKRDLITLLLRTSRMPSPLEVYIVIESTLRPIQQPLPVHLFYDEKERERYQRAIHKDDAQYWSTATQRTSDLTIYLTTLRQYGICLYGKSIEAEIPLVPAEAFRAALLATMQRMLEQRLHDPITFILNACQASAYLRTGGILSKSAAGEWALIYLPEEYHPLIEQALATYQGGRLKRPAGRAMLDNFAAFIKHSL